MRRWSKLCGHAKEGEAMAPANPHIIYDHHWRKHTTWFDKSLNLLALCKDSKYSTL